MKAPRLLAALLVFLITAEMAVAYPQLVPYVNGFAGVLTADQIVHLNAVARDIKASTTVEIAIVTVESTDGENRVLYANRLGEESGVGKAATDNGLVLLWSMDNEQGGAIAVGSGIESILNDAKVGRIGRRSRQYFDDWQYYNGFLSMLTDIKAELGAGSGIPYRRTAPTGPAGDDLYQLLFVIAVIILVMYLSRRYGLRGSSGFRAGCYIGRSLGGFRGGGGFGGGRFSGGGAKF